MSSPAMEHYIWAEGTNRVLSNEIGVTSLYGMTHSRLVGGQRLKPLVETIRKNNCLQDLFIICDQLLLARGCRIWRH